MMETQQKDQTFGVYEKGGGICSLKAINYILDITDFTMKKTIIQEFENAREKPVEMVYKFADSDQQTINFIEVELYDPEKDEKRVLKAKIEEKKKAQEKYDDAIADGSSAMLAEKDDDDRVTLNLGNILPKIQVTVKMDSVEEVKVEKALTISNDCTMKIKIPSLNYSGGQLENAKNNINVECKVKMTNGGKVTKLVSPSHPRAFDSIDDEIIRTVNKVSFNRDIDLEITVANAPLVSGLMEQVGEKDYVAAINLVPTFEEDAPIQTELIIIIDCSGSMSGARMRYAKKAMESFVDSLHDKSREHKIKMNVVRFGSRFVSMYPSTPETLNRNSYRNIKDYLDETTSNMGGTDILSPVRHVLQQKVTDGYTRQVFLLTDGEDENTERIIKFVRTHSKTTRFFSIGIGSGINPVLVERIAESSNGRAVFIRQNADTENKIMEQIEYALQPAVQDIQVKFPVEAHSVTEKIPACYNLQKNSLYYFTKDECESAELSYTIAGKAHRQTVPLTTHKGGLFLGSVAAKKRVRELTTAYDELKMTQEQAENEIRDLGMKFHFLTTQTSFLMVAENEDDAIMDDLAVESIQPVQRAEIEEVEEEEPMVQRNYQRNYYADAQRDAAPARRANYGGGGGGGGGWGNPFSIGGCVDSECDIKVLKKFEVIKRIKKKSEKEEGEEEFVVKKLREVEQGDYVESVNSNGEVEYSLVIERVNHQSEREVYCLVLEDGRELKLTGCHLIPYAKRRQTEYQKYKDIEAKKVKVGGWILVLSQEEGAQEARAIPMRIREVRKERAKVTIVYTNSGIHVVNGIVCSVFTKQKIFKVFYYYKKLFWNTPASIRPKIMGTLCDTFTHAVFVKEKYVFI